MLSSKFLDLSIDYITNPNLVINSGFIDVFREINQNSQEFSYWDQIRPHMRKNNKGWRIDYQMVSPEMKETIIAADQLNDIVNSDHCPVQVMYQL